MVRLSLVCMAVFSLVGIAKAEFDISSAMPVEQEVIEKWECKDLFGSWSDILVVADIYDGRSEGKVHVAGVSYWAQFKMKGFDRRWDFVLKDEGAFSYAFIVEPNGDAAYYDFSIEGYAKPSNVMKCRKGKES